MGGSLTTVTVNDPHEITPTMWEWFTPTPTSAITPPQFLARTYRAGDWRRYQIDKAAYETVASVGKIGPICFVQMADREATDMVLTSPGLEHYCLSFVQQGGGVLHRPGSGQDIAVDNDYGAIFQGHPHTVLQTGVGSMKVNVWIPAGLLRRQAATMLDGGNPGAVDLDAHIPAASGAGASLRRLTWSLLEELAHPDSLLSNAIGQAPAQELFLQSIVMAAMQVQPASLRRNGKAAAPGAVRRAEDYIRGNAQEVITVEDIANAAGCSVRALQLGFQRFRGTTPMAALRRTRLELAYQTMRQSDGSVSVAEVAARYGFPNAGRFATQYWRAFGEYPSATMRGRGARV